MNADKFPALEIEAFSENRSLIPIISFSGGFSVGWAFCIREAFRDALDLKLTSRVIDGRAREIYTQGQSFSFSEGDVIYDCREAYTLPWGDALHKIKTAIQVKAAFPSKVAATRTRMDFGSISFDVLRPNESCTALVPTSRQTTTQDLFVLYLQSGVFIDASGEPKTI